MIPARTREPIDLARLITAVGDVGRGGTVVFLGSVRRSEEDGPVEGIDYSAYEEMLDEEFQRITAEAEKRWRGVRCVGQHRLGVVPVGEPSIAVVAAAPHRDQAFAACRWIMEEAKARLPVWKRLQLEDGEQQWKDA
jgi:molybdopterin synthase catalytic subunit